MSLNFGGMSLNHTNGGEMTVTGNYTASDPLTITEDKLGLKFDGQLVQVNSAGQLTVNLNEIGSELTDKLNVDLSNISDAGKEVVALKSELPAMNEIMLNTTETIEQLSEDADNATIIAKINELIVALGNRGVINNQ